MDFNSMSWKQTLLWAPLGVGVMIGLAVVPVAPWIIGAIALPLIALGALTGS